MPRKIRPDPSLPPFNERRRKSWDWVQTLVLAAGSLGWAGALVVFLLIERASPQQETFWERLADVRVRTVWDPQPVRYAIWLMVAVFVLCLIGLAANMTRLRRSTDRINRPNAVLAVLSGAALLALLFRFGYLL